MRETTDLEGGQKSPGTKIKSNQINSNQTKIKPKSNQIKIKIKSKSNPFHLRLYRSIRDRFVLKDTETKTRSKALPFTTSPTTCSEVALQLQPPPVPAANCTTYYRNKLYFYFYGICTSIST